MSVVTQDYVNQLDPLYRDILKVFPDMEPGRKAGYGLALQTIYARLESKYSFGQIVDACKQMEAGNAVQIRNNFFVSPTSLGEDLITALTGHRPAGSTVPPFPPLPKG